MRSDRDNRTDSEREIDDFLSKFETPVDELSADIDSYLETADTTKMTAARTFYGEKYREVIRDDGQAAPVSDAVNIAAPVAAEVTAAAETVAAAPQKTEETKPEEKKPETKKSSGSKNSKNSKKKKKKKKSSKKKNSKKKKNGIDKTKIKNELFFKPNKAYNPDSTAAYVKYKGRKVKNKPYLFSIGKLFRDFILLGVAMVLCFMLYAVGCITLAPHIDPTDIYAAVDTSSMIYDDQGKEVDSVYYTQNRRVVPYDEMPEDLIDSFIAIEDKTFWKHHGFNWTRMIGAVLSSFRGEGRISGTSTITQQLARNVYLSDIKSVRSLRRKIVEMYYASKIERKLTFPIDQSKRRK